MMTDLINSLEALAGKVTPGPLMTEEDPCDDQAHAVLVVTKGVRSMPGTWVMRAEHNWTDADYSERRISWKEAEANAAATALLLSNLPTIIAALKVAELMRDEDWLAGVLFHADGYVNETEARNAARAIIAAMGEEVK